MKKTKLVATILTICLAISTLAYGVYAATNLSFGITANVAFEVQNLFFEMELKLSAYDSSGNADVNTHTYNWGASYSPTLVADTTALNNWATANVNDFTGLYFNSGSTASAITIEVTIKNRTPSKDIQLTIADDNAGENESKYANVNSVKTNAIKTIAKQTGETPNQATASISYTPKNLSTPFTFTPNWTISIDEYVASTTLGFRTEFIEDATQANSSTSLILYFNADGERFATINSINTTSFNAPTGEEITCNIDTLNWDDPACMIGTLYFYLDSNPSNILGQVGIVGGSWVGQSNTTSFIFTLSSNDTLVLSIDGYAG